MCLSGCQALPICWTNSKVELEMQHQETGDKWNPFWKWKMAVTAASFKSSGLPQTRWPGPALRTMKSLRHVGSNGEQICWETGASGAADVVLKMTLWSSADAFLWHSGLVSLICHQNLWPHIPSLIDEGNNAEKAKWLAQGHTTIRWQSLFTSSGLEILKLMPFEFHWTSEKKYIPIKPLGCWDGKV